MAWNISNIISYETINEESVAKRETIMAEKESGAKYQLLCNEKLVSEACEESVLKRWKASKILPAMKKSAKSWQIWPIVIWKWRNQLLVNRGYNGENLGKQPILKAWPKNIVLINDLWKKVISAIPSIKLVTVWKMAWPAIAENIWWLKAIFRNVMYYSKTWKRRNMKSCRKHQPSTKHNQWSGENDQ